MADGSEDESEFSGIECSYRTTTRTYGLSSDTKAIDTNPVTLAETNAIDTETFRCDRHADVAAVKFCNNHDEAVCLECAKFHHRGCKDVATLEELAKANTKGKKAKQYVTELDSLIQKISKLKQAKNEDLSKLRAETSTALNAITEFRKEINGFLDKLERKGKTFIEKRYRELHSDVKDDLDICEKTLSSLEKLKKRMERLEDKTEKFLTMKMGSSKLARAQNLCKEMKETRTKSELVKMSIDPLVQRVVMNLRWYGKYRTYLSMESPPSLPHAYKIKHDAHYDIRRKGDKSVCTIVDVCQLQDGTILLADAANQNIKQLDVTYKIVDYCELPGSPAAICMTPGGAAVLLQNETGCQVHEIRVSPAKLTLAGSFKVPETSTGLGFCDGVYFVTSNTSILTYSLSGEYVRVIHEDASGNFGHVRVNDAGSRLFVTDSARGLVSMDTDGADGELFIDPELKKASGVCCDRSDQVLLCGYDSHNVIQLGQGGERLGVLVNQRKDIRCPTSLCYDGVNKRLVIAQKSKNFIKVYQLK